MAGLFPELVGEKTMVTLQDVVTTSVDAYGQPIKRTEDLTHCLADISTLLSRGREMVSLRQAYPTSTHIVRLPWLGEKIPSTPDNPYRKVLSRMRVIIDKDHTVLNIITKGLDNASREWVLVCSEREGEGAAELEAEAG